MSEENNDELAAQVNDAMTEATMELFAKSVAGYYLQLVANGVPEEHAITLTAQMQMIFVSGGLA